MDLIRLDSNPNSDPPGDHYQREYEVHKVEERKLPEYSTLRVNFNRFGRGEERRSNFAVEVSWLDVKGFVCEFIEMGHPEAVCLQRMLKLAEAIADDPPPKDFWEIMP